MMCSGFGKSLECLVNGIQRVGVAPAVDELSTVEQATNPAEFWEASS